MNTSSKLKAAKSVAVKKANAYHFPCLFKRTSGGRLQVWRIKVIDGDAAKIITKWGIDDGKQQIARDYIDQGKSAGRSNATTAFEQAVLEAHARWVKQQDRKKYSLDATGQESADKRQLSPMLAQKYKDAKKHIDWSNCWAQPKLDGFRCIARRELNRVTLMSRGFKFFNAPHLEKELMGILKNVGDALDGELYIHGKPINIISSSVNRGEPVDSRVEYHVYDTDSFSGDYKQRRQHLCSRLMAADKLNKVKEVPTFNIKTEKELMKLHRTFVKEGFEGTIIRHGKLPYENDKRSKGLIKLKTLCDEEFKIVGAKTGRGKFRVCCIFECETGAGNRFEVPAPGTLQDRKECWIHHKEYIGQFLTVRYPYYTKTDKPVPFHPVAVRVRPSFDRDEK